MRPHCHNSDEDYGPAVAIVTMEPSGMRVPICGYCIDYWFDNADAEPELEPSAIEWLVKA